MTIAHRIEKTINPFSTRFIRPGRIAPLDAEGHPVAIADLAARARAQPACALVGPHGSGKSNLLAALAGELSRDVATRTFRIRSNRDALSLVVRLARDSGPAFLCVDGWEQAGVALQLAVRLVARWRRYSLMVTAHRACGLPALVTCTTSPMLLERIVAELPSHQGLIEPNDLAEAFAGSAGNLREALFDLYDRFEARARAVPVDPSMTALTSVPVVPSAAEKFTKHPP